MNHWLFFVCSLLLPLNGWAWGGLGHRTTAKIAWHQLTPATQKAVENLLGNEDFVHASTWADGIRDNPEWDHVTRFHFVQVPDGGEYLTMLAGLTPTQQKKGDVVMALLKSVATLHDTSINHLQRRWALKFLLHWLGDLHQPLHTGPAHDHGGNNTMVTWFGELRTLHHLWDSSLIMTAHATELRKKDPLEQATWYANYLQNIYPQNATLCAPDLLAWLDQAIAVRPQAYKNLHLQNNFYLQLVLPILESQLAQGGYNLACILNQIFAPAAPNDAELDLRRRILQILGHPFESWIRLEPRQFNSTWQDRHLQCRHD